MFQAKFSDGIFCPPPLFSSLPLPLTLSLWLFDIFPTFRVSWTGSKKVETKNSISNWNCEKNVEKSLELHVRRFFGVFKFWNNIFLNNFCVIFVYAMRQNIWRMDGSEEEKNERKETKRRRWPWSSNWESMPERESLALGKASVNPFDKWYWLSG